MRTFGAGIIGLLCLIAIAGCTTNKSIANITTPKATLQLAVGTINDSAGTLGLGGTTLNVVSTFRNVLGNSAYQNPGFYTLTGPGGTIVPSNASNPCDQLFSYGDFPGCEGDSLGEAIWGMPPTYNPPNPNGGYALGFIQTGAPATGGNYTLSTSVPVNGQNVHYTASATLPASPLVLPNATGVTSFVSDHNGGGTFTIGNPLRPRDHGRPGPRGVPNPVTEYLIVVSNTDTSGPQPVVNLVATVETTNTTATITGTGSPGACSPIPCTSATSLNQAYVIEADYPLVESGPPANTQVAPTLTGANGTADISVSGLFTVLEN